MEWLIIVNESAGDAYIASSGEWEENDDERLWGRYPTEEAAKEKLPEAQLFMRVMFG